MPLRFYRQGMDAVFGSVDADEGHIGSSANVGSGDRPLITNGDVSVTVDPGGGADYTTIQAALDDVPLHVRHRYEININAGTYNEDVVIHPSIVGDFSATAGYERGDVVLIGDTATPSNVQVDSLSVGGFLGTANSPFITGLQFTSVNPYDDEDASIVIYGCTGVGISACEFTATAMKAILTYSSTVNIDSCDISGGSYDYGLFAKTMGLGYVEGWTGSAGNTTFRAGKGILVVDGATVPNSASDLGASHGLVIDSDTGEVWGMERVVTGLQNTALNNTGMGTSKRVDLSSMSGSFDGEMLMSNGTAGTAGQYYSWDASGSQWVRVGDATETI